MIESIVFLFIGLGVGFVAGFFIKRKSNDNESTADNGSFEQKLKEVQNEKETLIAEKSELKGRLENSIEVFKQKDQQVGLLEAELKSISQVKIELAKENEFLNTKLSEQVQTIDELNVRFKKEFENLANEILKKNVKEFSDSNQKQVGEILIPLREKIESFEKRVNEVYSDETKTRSEMMAQINMLKDLNIKISEDATNLTKALKGDSQKQGAWGEFILESILEHSGLEKGIEYETQVSNRTEEGLFRPDVVINLPDEKYIIVDSKVSLVAYEALVNADNDQDQAKFTQQHIASVRQHVKSLSDKDYTSKSKGQSLDFVLLFIPIEAGFSEALKNDPGLYNYAWDNRIVLVSPTTLLATLRTIASVWKQEKQNKNVIKIAEESGKLYDKFVGFLADMENIKKGIDKSSEAYDNAFNKLHSGRGNLIKKAEDIKALGAKTSKSIDPSLIDDHSELE